MAAGACLQNMHFNIGTRGSRLALWQAEFVAHSLHQQGHTSELVIIETRGDKLLEVSIGKIGSKGVFTEELENALRDGRIDLAVHSAKDMQSSLPADLEIIAFTEREQMHDVVLSLDLGFRLETAAPGTVIGTSSTRRRATLARHFPQLATTEMRGNLQTRLEKLKAGNAAAMLLAYAGVHRMAMDGYVVQHLPMDTFTPAAAQGSIAIETLRSLDAEKKAAINSVLNHAETELCLLAERALLATLQGGCSVPVFALAQINAGELSLEAGLISLDGKREIRHRGNIAATAAAAKAVALGQRVAQSCLADGAAELLAEIKRQQASA